MAHTIACIVCGNETTPKFDRYGELESEACSRPRCQRAEYVDYPDWFYNPETFWLTRHIMRIHSRYLCEQARKHA